MQPNPVNGGVRSATEVMDGINRSAWRAPGTVQWFAELEGWTDPGERAAIEYVAREARDQPILDLGVGGGRTVPLMLQLSRDYTGLDYTPELVLACRNKYPDVCIESGDARDLSEFVDHSFALVMFSFNGIDAMNPEDRLKTLREVHRVLRPRGLFLFSTHNRNGPGHGEHLQLGIYATRNPFKLAPRILRALVMSPLTISNHLRYSRLNQPGERYSIMNAAAHHHSILIHYITVEEQCRQLVAAGFRGDPVIFGNLDGAPVAPDDPAHGQTWLHFVARKA
jgi:SAM-dependent methyltransferase